MTGGGANDEQKKKYKNMSHKLMKQHKEHEKLLEEKKNKEKELLNLEKQYSSLQEEVRETRQAYQLYKEKCENLEKEIKDINNEHEIQKEDLLDLLRISQKNEQLYLGISKILLTEKEVEIIKSASEWDNDNQEFKIPFFTFREKELKFPKFLNPVQGSAGPARPPPPLPARTRARTRARTHATHNTHTHATRHTHTRRHTHTQYARASAQTVRRGLQAANSSSPLSLLPSQRDDGTGQGKQRDHPE